MDKHAPQSPDDLIFVRRNPDKIGNGRFDYAITYNDNYLGLLRFGYENSAISDILTAIVYLGDSKIHLPLRHSMICECESNDAVLELCRKDVFHVIQAKLTAEAAPDGGGQG